MKEPSHFHRGAYNFLQEPSQFHRGACFFLQEPPHFHRGTCFFLQGRIISTGGLAISCRNYNHHSSTIPSAEECGMGGLYLKIIKVEFGLFIRSGAGILGG